MLDCKLHGGGTRWVWFTTVPGIVHSINICSKYIHIDVCVQRYIHMHTHTHTHTHAHTGEGGEENEKGVGEGDRTNCCTIQVAQRKYEPRAVRETQEGTINSF